MLGCDEGEAARDGWPGKMPRLRLTRKQSRSQQAQRAVTPGTPDPIAGYHFALQVAFGGTFPIKRGNSTSPAVP
jgi:hypothetical protein